MIAEMWFLTLIAYIALFVQVCFATIAVAAGLYYLAELVEEYTSISRKVIWWLNTIAIMLYAGLWLFQDFPSSMIVCGLLAHFTHYALLINFPQFTFTSPSFLFTVMFVVTNHYLAFKHFANLSHTFAEVTAYFTLCLWLVPFALFVSLSANENVLPTVVASASTLDRRGGGGGGGGEDNDIVSNYFSKKNKRYGLLTLFNYVKESILPQRTKKEF